MAWNTVPSRTTRAKAPNSRLLVRKAASLETGEAIDPGTIVYFDTNESIAERGFRRLDA